MKKAFLISLGAFLALHFTAEIFGLMRNSECFAVLGCNAGFFGYDALVHFVSGIAIATGVAWLMGRDARMKAMLDSGFWMNVLAILAVAALVGVSWEILEFIFDHVRMDVFHMNLVHPNVMAQASNSDTMGDLSFGLFGAFAASVVTRIRRVL